MLPAVLPLICPWLWSYRDLWFSKFLVARAAFTMTSEIVLVWVIFWSKERHIIIILFIIRVVLHANFMVFLCAVQEVEGGLFVLAFSLSFPALGRCWWLLLLIDGLTQPVCDFVLSFHNLLLWTFWLLDITLKHVQSQNIFVNGVILIEGLGFERSAIAGETLPLYLGSVGKSRAVWEAFVECICFLLTTWRKIAVSREWWTLCQALVHWSSDWVCDRSFILRNIKLTFLPGPSARVSVARLLSLAQA